VSLNEGKAQSGALLLHAAPCRAAFTGAGATFQKPLRAKPESRPLATWAHPGGAPGGVGTGPPWPREPGCRGEPHPRTRSAVRRAGRFLPLPGRGPGRRQSNAARSQSACPWPEDWTTPSRGRWVSLVMTRQTWRGAARSLCRETAQERGGETPQHEAARFPACYSFCYSAGYFQGGAACASAC